METEITNESAAPVEHEDCIYLKDCEVLKDFDAWYSANLHTPLVLIICALGTFANSCNLVILNRKDMASPTNQLLSGLSLAQLCLVVNNLLFEGYDAIRHIYKGPQTYEWATLKLVTGNLSVVFHTVALSITVMLAVFRYIAVRLPTKARGWVTIRAARKCVLVIYVAIPLICSPTYFSSSVVLEYSEEEAASTDKIHETFLGEESLPFRRNTTSHANQTFSAQQKAQGDSKIPVTYDINFTSELLLSLTLWIYGTLFKLIPCIIISFLSLGLIRSLKEVEKRKQKLKGQGRSCSVSSFTVKEKEEKSSRNRITKMLLLIVLLFVLVELPQGIMNLLTGILGYAFAYEIYNYMADFLSMLTLLYSSINFVLYCVMSTQFQHAFNETFRELLFRILCVPESARMRSPAKHGLLKDGDSQPMVSISAANKSRANSNQSGDARKGSGLEMKSLIANGACSPKKKQFSPIANGNNNHKAKTEVIYDYSHEPRNDYYSLTLTNSESTHL